MDILNTINQPIVGSNLAKDKIDPKKQNYNATISTTKASSISTELDLSSTQSSAIVGKTYKQQDQVFSHQPHQAIDALKHYGKEQQYNPPMQKTWYTSLSDKIGSPELQSAADAYAQLHKVAQESIDAPTTPVKESKPDIAQAISESYPQLVDVAETANEAQQKARSSSEENVSAQDKQKAEQKEEKGSDKVDPQNQKKSVSGEPLTEEELQEVKELEKRDKEVRVHELAHKAAGGQYAGAPKYKYETGPDGRRYISDGEVSISISSEQDPAKTIEKMRIVKRAALAPQEPSAQDRQVYNEAHQKELQAQQELNKQKQAEKEASDELKKQGTAPTQENIEKYVEKEKKKQPTQTDPSSSLVQPQTSLTQNID